MSDIDNERGKSNTDADAAAFAVHVLATAVRVRRRRRQPLMMTTNDDEDDFFSFEGHAAILGSVALVNLYCPLLGSANDVELLLTLPARD